MLGIKFSEDNRFLLKEFCKIGLTKDGLMDLWDKLCTAIETYHVRAQNILDGTDSLELDTKL